MKRPLYRLGVMLLALVLVLALPVTSFAATANEWDTSKSKRATNLNSNYISNITLSLPSAQETLETDVVFVLDKSTSDGVEDQVLAMLRELNTQAKQAGATVNVGVVIFNKTANIETELIKLDDESIADDGAITTAVKKQENSGTNTHAGLLAGKRMLDNHTSVAANRKYLIFVTDGITYLFDDGQGNTMSIVSENYEYRGPEIKATRNMAYEGAAFKYQYSTNMFESETVSAYLNRIGQLINSDNKKYWVSYDSNPDDAEHALTSKLNANGQQNLTDEDYAGISERGDDVYLHANNLDTALYLTSEVFSQCVASRYHCYALNATDTNYETSQYPWAPVYMEYLADLSGNGEVDFSAIKNDIYYLLDAGSSVVDYMGYVADDYNFDFVDDENKISLTVGDKKYTTTKIARTGDETSHYIFTTTYDGPAELSSDDKIVADFELIYYKGDGAATEYFIWKINVPVSNFAPVQLTYSVKLVNRKTAPGTYGQYDADGSKGYTALYTNNSATLYPIDSNRFEGAPEEFKKPTVSYTIAGQETETPTPSFPTYYPDYSEQPVATPTPTPFVPSDETSPKTGAGDAALPALIIVALAAAGVVVVSMRKRAR